MPRPAPQNALRRKILQSLDEDAIANVTQFAQALGAQRPSVSRLLSQLQLEGLVQKEGKSWSLTNSGRQHVTAWEKNNSKALSAPSVLFSEAVMRSAQSYAPMFAEMQRFTRSFEIPLASMLNHQKTIQQITTSNVIQSLASQIAILSQPSLSEWMIKDLNKSAAFHMGAETAAIGALNNHLVSQSLQTVLQGQFQSVALLRDLVGVSDVFASAPLTKALSQVNFGLATMISNMESIVGTIHTTYSSVSRIFAPLAEATRTFQSYLTQNFDEARIHPLTYPATLQLVAPAKTASTLIHTVRLTVEQEHSTQESGSSSQQVAEPWLVQIEQVDHVISRCGASYASMWRGSWSVLSSANPDRYRQAAHSGRELLAQLLEKHAPMSTFTSQELQEAPNGRPTRRMRVRKILAHRDGATDFVEATARMLDEMYGRLSGISHDHAPQPIVTEHEVSGFLLTLGGILWLLFGGSSE